MAVPEIQQQILERSVLLPLHQARQAVLALPGIEHYLPDPTAELETLDRGIDQMVEDVIKQLDAENMIPLITWNMGWSDAQATEFFSHPQRQPYQSYIELSSDFDTRVQQFLTVGLYLRAKYIDAKRQIEKPGSFQRIKGNFSLFYESTLYNLFAPHSYAFVDRFNDIDPLDRKKGTLQPSQANLRLIKEVADEVAQKAGIEPDKLYQDILLATEGGNTQIIYDYLTNHRGHPSLRRALEVILLRQVNNFQQNFAVEKLQLNWISEVYRLAMGLDLDTLYEVNEYPNGKIIEELIHAFLTNPDYVKNTWAHLRREAPSVVALYEKTGLPIPYFSILKARADFHHFQDIVETQKEIEAKITRTWSELAEIFPLAATSTPLSFMDAPTVMGANTRASNITYVNKYNQVVNIVHLNPRIEESLFRAVSAHEWTHKLHKLMLITAERAQHVPTGSFDRVPYFVKEEFSLLIENQIAAIWTNKDSQKKEDAQAVLQLPEGEFRDLYDAITMRGLGPFALTQRAIRVEMEKMWNYGKRNPLTKNQARQLIDGWRLQVESWFMEGLPIWQSTQRVFNNLSTLNPFDGLVYLSKYLIEPIPASPSPSPSKTQPIDMKSAFRRRFGNNWLLKKDARAVLLALMAETGNNYDITTYGAFVLQADLDQINQTLRSWGITEDQI